MTMIGMPIGKKTPKSELHEFYQLHPGNPKFEIRSMSNPPAEPLFLCTLTCPAIGGHQDVQEQTFLGQGRNKKTAEQYAAEKALTFLRQRGLMAPALVEMEAQQLPADLQRQLAGSGAGNSTGTTPVSTPNLPSGLGSAMQPIYDLSSKICTATFAALQCAAVCLPAVACKIADHLHRVGTT